MIMILGRISDTQVQEGPGVECHSCDVDLFGKPTVVSFQEKVTKLC